MKLALFFLTIAISSASFAMSDEQLAKQCLEVGKAKLTAQAKGYGCAVDLNQIEVQEVDNRFLNPSKYVWYQLMGACKEADRVIVMVQYHQGKCF